MYFVKLIFLLSSFFSIISIQGTEYRSEDVCVTGCLFCRKPVLKQIPALGGINIRQENSIFSQSGTCSNCFIKVKVVISNIVGTSYYDVSLKRATKSALCDIGIQYHRAPIMNFGRILEDAGGDDMIGSHFYNNTFGAYSSLPVYRGVISRGKDCRTHYWTIVGIDSSEHFERLRATGASKCAIIAFLKDIKAFGVPTGRKVKSDEVFEGAVASYTESFSSKELEDECSIS